jgi:quercetin dioxygenase-like cupin family protein
MSKVLRGSLASYALVAGVAAALSAFVTWQGTLLVTPSAAQPAAAGIQQIVTQPLADVPGREVRMILIERGPASASPPHRHPGHHTFGYVLEGTYEFAIDRREPRLLKTGDTFYEPPGAVHSTSRNPSTDQRVKLLVFMVADQKNPTTVPE